MVFCLHTFTLSLHTMERNIIVSIITPVHNGEHWIQECFESIFQQDILNERSIGVEVCVYNDASTDSSERMLQTMRTEIAQKRIPNLSLKILTGGTSKGVGFARNRAVEMSSGEFLCFLDIDDTMDASRISKQLEYAKKHPLAIVGSRFRREPENSTARFSRWANSLAEEQLCVQVYTSHGPTVVMPTWFCSRHVFDRVGGFSETGRGCPEDAIFFYRHLDVGGDVRRVDQELITYRHHPHATTFSIPQSALWDLRVARLEALVLPQWPQVTIWNAGKQGRRLWRSLAPHNRSKVTAFCDVDAKKVGGHYQPHPPPTASLPIPIIHFRDAKPPFVICVKLDLTGGEFEKNLASLCLTEGVDYILFS